MGSGQTGTERAGKMRHDKETLCKAAVAKFGERDQIQKAIEELAELIQALCKYTFDTSNLWAIDSIREEWADVEIMLGQLRVIFGDNSQALDAKLDHLAWLVGK